MIRHLTKMVRVELIFVDNKAQTKLGFARGGIVLCLLLLVLFAFYAFMQPKSNNQTWKTVLVIFLCSLILASVISIAHPKTIRESVIYGGLVGFVFFAVVAFVLWAQNGSSSGADVGNIIIFIFVWNHCVFIHCSLAVFGDSDGVSQLHEYINVVKFKHFSQNKTTHPNNQIFLFLT